jgi:vacuolar-type H+-ATPase subunit F/Vma7
MSRAAVIGEAVRVEGYVLAGAVVYPAEDADQACAAWRSLPPDIAVVVLTARAAAWLDEAPQRRDGVLLVVMPP